MLQYLNSLPKSGWQVEMLDHFRGRWIPHAAAPGSPDLLR